MNKNIKILLTIVGFLLFGGLVYSTTISDTNMTIVNAVFDDNELCFLNTCFGNYGINTDNASFEVNNTISAVSKSVYGTIYGENSGNIASVSGIFHVVVDGTSNDDNGYGILVDANDVQAGKSIIGLGINMNNSMQRILLGNTLDDTTGTNWFYRNLNSSITGAPLVFIEQDHSSDDQDTLKIQQDGTGKGIFIDQNGHGIALDIDSESANTSLRIQGNSTLVTCNAGNDGGIYYDSTVKHMYFCNGTGFRQMDT